MHKRRVQSNIIQSNFWGIIINESLNAGKEILSQVQIISLKADFISNVILSADNQRIVIHFFSLTKKAIKGICHYSAIPARAVSNQHQITFILLLINRCFTCRVKKSF